MRILFDLSVSQPNSTAKYHGGGKYGYAVFQECLNSKGIVWEVAFYANRFIEKHVLSLIEVNNVRVHDLSRESLQIIIDRGNFDVFYSPIPQKIPWIASKKVTYIFTLHGLRGLELPNDKFYLKYRQTKKETIKVYLKLYFSAFWNRKKYKELEDNICGNNHNFVVDSNHTKYSIMSYFPGIKETRIKVFYAPSTSLKNVDDVIPYSCKKYILLVSGNRPEKNVLRVLIAIDELISERNEFKDTKIYTTGAMDNTFKIKLKNKKSFEMLGYVSEKELQQLYAGAYCFVYPSLNEGFGYPPIEAMRFGVPVLSSPFSSIYEVCGDAALYFNPFDKFEIKNRLLQCFISDDIRNTLIANGKNRFFYISKKQNKDLKDLVDYICQDRIQFNDK